MSNLDIPRAGPCSPWIGSSDVLSLPSLSGVDVDEGLAATMAVAASDLLYALSGRQFTGTCGPVTVRPVARPTDTDTRFSYRGVPSGYLSGGQAATAWGGPGGGGAVNYYGASKPSMVSLDAYPVIQILTVKIDGVVIPSNEYYVQGRRVLVRRRPSASTPPTQRYGWPVNQLLDLPDTEPGTFSVRYRYGAPPPAMGVFAAKTLAAQLVLDSLGAENSLPERVTAISRQGVTVDVVDVMDFFSKGLTGIYTVDLFVKAYNPAGVKNRPLVWSPDIGPAKRMARDSGM